MRSGQRTRLALLVALAACQPTPVTQVMETPSAMSVRARLPSAPGAFAPSLVAVEGTIALDLGADLADIETCASCHPDVATAWQGSAHSFASFGNPIYRQNVEMIREALGREASQHCGGCHDMPLVVDGTMQADIPADDARAHQGVTCRLCHGSRGATPDGNGSYRLATASAAMPTVDDPASIAAHREEVSLRGRGNDLCLACHRGFISPDLGLPAHLSGIDEPSAWSNSAYTRSGAMRVDQVAPADCVSCHMPSVVASADEAAGDDHRVRSHRFAGGHTWMAAMRGDAAQAEAIARQLRTAVTLEVAAGSVEGDGRGLATSATPLAVGPGRTWYAPVSALPLPPGQPVAFDVVVRNVGVGHRFPGGVLDMHDTWLEVTVRDFDGRTLATHGHAHATAVDDAEAHVLRSLVADEAGQILRAHELHRFRAPIANHTLGPREAQVIRYRWQVPSGLTRGAELTVRLRHRSRTLHQQALACAAARTATGQAFARGWRDTRDGTIDPCPPQPITELANQRYRLDGRAGPVSWHGIYDLGMALTTVVSERLDEARVVLEAGLARAPDARGQAMVLAQLGWVAAKQGRVDDAQALVAQGRAAIIASGATAMPPVFDAVEADALARVWRWAEAVGPARRLAHAAPRNTGAWGVLARALASSGDDLGALAAARRGLALWPRDPDLLRSQATALASLGAPEAAAALQAFDRFRTPDVASEVRLACARTSAVCATEREAGHAHDLVPTARRAGPGSAGSAAR